MSTRDILITIPFAIAVGYCLYMAWGVGKKKG